MATFDTPSMSNVLYDNLAFNPLNGRVTGNWRVVLNTSRRLTLDITFAFKNGDNDSLLDRQTFQIPIVEATQFVEGSFAMTFDATGGQLPSSVKIEMSGSQPTAFGRQTLFPTLVGIIPFSGTLPEPPQPNINMVIVATNPEFTFDGDRLDTDLFAAKTQEFPDEFDFEGMKFVFNVIDLDTGQPLAVGELPFVFGQADSFQQPFTLNNLGADRIKLTVAVWNEDNAALSDSIETIYKVELPPEPEPELNFRIEATAENGFTINGTVTPEDWDFLNSEFGVTVLNGTITGFEIEEPALLTANQVMSFLFDNLIPIGGGDNFKITVSFDNGAPNRMFVLDPIELDFVKNNLASCASIIDEVPTSDPSQGFDFVIGEIFEACGDIPGPGPGPGPGPQEGISERFTVGFDNGAPDKIYILNDSEFAALQDILPSCATIKSSVDSDSVSFGLQFVLDDIGSICATGGPGPGELPNTCFCLLFSDSTSLCFTLSDADFQTLIASIPGGDQAPILSSVTDCDTQADTITIVRNAIINKISTLPGPGNGGLTDNQKIALALGGVVAAGVAAIAITSGRKKKKNN